MTKYLLFAGSNYYPMGGVYDLKGRYETLQEAQEAMSNYANSDWVHVYETRTGLVVEERG